MRARVICAERQRRRSAARACVWHVSPARGQALQEAQVVDGKREKRGRGGRAGGRGGGGGEVQALQEAQAADNGQGLAAARCKTVCGT